MTSPTNKLKRREFLTGAASTIGAGLVAAIPGLANAQGLGSSTGTTLAATTALFYWNGTKFVPAALAVPNVNADHIQVQISGHGVSQNISSIDVQMPGGVFHAFTAQPQGQSIVRFSAPVSQSDGLDLTIIGKASKSLFRLQSGSWKCPVLATGTYLLADAGVSTNGFILSESTTTPVTYEGGQGVTIPYALICVSE